MSDQMTPRQHRFANAAACKLQAEQVDTSDHAAVKACLLRCVAGNLLWRAWKNRATMQAAAPRQLSMTLDGGGR